MTNDQIYVCVNFKGLKEQIFNNAGLLALWFML